MISKPKRESPQIGLKVRTFFIIRKLEMLRQLAHGRTNREIAEALFISEEMVKTHIGNILSKLHLAHRTLAAIYALKQGLVSMEELKL